MKSSILQPPQNKDNRSFNPGSDPWGVLVVNMGGPESLSEIRPYLYRLFSDRNIIQLPLSPVLQGPFARLISLLRTPKVAKRYQLIGGGSPLLRHSRELVSRVEQKLRTTFPTVRLYLGMRYTDPSLQDQLQAVSLDGCRHLVIVPLYPHYCLATTGTAFSVIEGKMAGGKLRFSLCAIDDYHAHPEYIRLIRNRLQRVMRGVRDPGRTKVIFSAHSIPVKLRDQGDPYVTQIEESCRLAGEGYDYLLSYQSVTGPVQWVGPETLETITGLAKQGTKRVVIVPISFVADNIETLYDIDILMASRCRELNMEPLLRVPCLNADDDFAEFLAKLVQEKVLES